MFFTACLLVPLIFDVFFNVSFRLGGGGGSAHTHTHTRTVLQVDIAMLKDVTGSQQFEVPIDDSVLDITVQLAGYMKDAVIQDATGTCTLPSLRIAFCKASAPHFNFFQKAPVEVEQVSIGSFMVLMKD